MKKLEARRKFLLLIILIVLISIYWYQKSTVAKITVQIPQNTIILSNFNFIYEHWTEEKLFTLVENEDYKDITAKEQFEYFLDLCTWTHHQWENSIPNPYPLSNALDILS